MSEIAERNLLIQKLTADLRLAVEVIEMQQQTITAQHDQILKSLDLSLKANLGLIWDFRKALWYYADGGTGPERARAVLLMNPVGKDRP